MKRVFAAALTALLLTTGSAQAASADKPTTEVGSAKELRQLYADYNAALLQKDGRKAASYLHTNILAAYLDALELAKTASREQMQDVPAHKKLISLFIRWAAAPEDVAEMTTAQDVVAFMVRKGALRSEAEVSTDVRDFEYKDDEAVGQLYARKQKTNLRLRFAKEDGAWKIDLTDLNAMADDIYAQSAELQKISQDEALLQLVAAGTNKPVTDEIWIPLNERKRAS